MKYFIYIFIFGVIGTICNFIMVGICTLIANKMGMFSFTVKRKTINMEKKHDEERERLRYLQFGGEVTFNSNLYENYSSILGEDVTPKKNIFSIK